jgi:membrane protein YqaA with SNARE-associated domain
VNCIRVPCALSHTEIGDFPQPRPWTRSRQPTTTGEAHRVPRAMPYYAMCSTAGSVCGASVTYRLSGLGVLHRRIKGAAFDRVTAFLKRFGSLALLLAALLPPPFPTSAFVFSAGATRYCFIAFALSFRTGRVCRFALLAYLASSVWQAIPGEGVVGPHAGTSSSFWRRARVYRVGGVAGLQEI